MPADLTGLAASAGADPQGPRGDRDEPRHNTPSGDAPHTTASARARDARHGRVERHRRGHRPAARARARTPRSCSSRAARSACARSPRSLGEHASFVAVDLLDEDAPERVRDHVGERHGRLDLLVNNAGAAWRARFADGGYENVQRTMAINFDAQVRLTETLLPLLRASAPSAIVNVASTAGRVARAGTGAYSASKFALAGWSDSL